MLPNVARYYFSRSGVNFYSSASFVPAILKKRKLKPVSSKNVVFITGCDSGLGYNLAIFCHSLNMTVISGSRNTNSEGTKLLQSLPNPDRIIPVQIDVKNPQSISKASRFVKDVILEKDREFTALINNAGIMCFGEFEWQTPTIFESQIETNLLGPMRVTKEFLPLIRMHRSRIINVTSHCALHALPGLSPYTASKAGLAFWTDAIRMELKKYDVQVVDFVPGSFVTVSNIAAKQQEFAEEMWKGLDDEQKEFYGDYFHRYNSYLTMLSGKKSPVKMDDRKLFEKFRLALLDTAPLQIYKHEPIRYTIYHYLFRNLPTSLRDYSISKFVGMPQYIRPKTIEKNIINQ